jgi:serine/threonine protein kinase
MLVTFHCSHCNAKLRINANAMGTELNCPECEGLITVPQSSLGPGFVVGGFLIKHKIGQGGMGEVYLARQLSLERDVALKILPAQFTRENSFVVRFLKEVHYQAKLDHPNIVTAYDAGEDNGVYFMAMAYVAGETLEDLLNREGVLSESEALTVVRQVALALQYATEQKGILHRDIKPANIMIGKGFQAKVLDMGLSKNTLEKHSNTHADTLLGTPNYMSPEQIDRPQSIDTRSDMFSLGMTLYNMLTGKIPFEDSSYLKTLRRHGLEKLEDPRSLIPGLTRGVVLLLARMLARDPDDRFATWDDFLSALQHVNTKRGPFPTLPEGPSTLGFADPDARSAPAPSPARPTTSVHTAVPLRPQARRLAIAASVASGLLLGLIGIALLLRFGPDSASGKTPQPRPSPSPPPATPTPTPLPPHVVAVDVEALGRTMTEIILAYERDPANHDETLRQLLDLGTAGAGSAIADAAAQQILRVRRDRETAVAEDQRRLRENILRTLQQQGPDAARASLDAYTGPFLQELEPLRRTLARRIDQWEQQERSQRETEQRLARERYQDLIGQVAPFVLQPDWARALKLVDDAASDSAYFAVAADVATLRREITALQNVPRAILDSYRPFLNQDVPIHTRSNGIQVLRIREIQPEGLLVARTLYSQDGELRGSVESALPFSELSVRERMERMDSLKETYHDLYRALVAHQSGNPEACRHFLAAADSDLARAVSTFLYGNTPKP